MVKVATAIPAEQLHTSTYRDIARHLQSLQLPRPDYIGDVPVVMKLSDDQYDALRPSFTEPTPTELVSPDAQRINRFGVLQLALGASIGTVLSIPSVRDGAVVQNIFPKDFSRTILE